MENELKRSRYTMNLQHFAEADPDPDPTPPAPDKTFTQAELDLIVADRLARERKKAEKFADYDELKTKLTALELAEAERAKADLTEAERLTADLEAARIKAQEAENRGTAAITAANRRLINAEFRALAREKNVPADRLAAALKLADLGATSVDDEGNPVGVKEAVEALIVAEPYLVAETKPKPIGGGGGGNPDEDERKTLEAQLLEAQKARNFSKVIEISNKLNKK
ncbi:phage scaffolding protein [Paenibacillus sp. FSL K6-2859]|uniref:phage scaffolding protein n=1 Tax=Paenibacillus sp. FSL K6-2859 TaxID=2921482 RepID=UPI0030FC8711